MGEMSERKKKEEEEKKKKRGKPFGEKLYVLVLTHEIYYLCIL